MANFIVTEGMLNIYAHVRDSEQKLLDDLIQLIEDVFTQGHREAWIPAEDYVHFHTYLRPAKEYQRKGIQHVIEAGARWVLVGQFEAYFAAHNISPYLAYLNITSELSSFIRNEIYSNYAK